MTYNTEIYVSFNYGCWKLSFSKTFDLPFAPFYGLVLSDHTEDSEVENDIELVTNDYCNTRIYYSVCDNCFEVNVRNVWKWSVSDETIDGTLEAFEKTNWKRQDTTDIVALKELMKRNAEENKR